MTNKLDTFNKTQLKQNIPDIRPGDIIRVHQKIKEKGKERIQVFEGLVIARKHGKGLNATFTVRKISQGVGVEKVFPLHSPAIAKIELVKRSKVRRAKLYYIRKRRDRKARMKTKELLEQVWEEPKEEKEKKEEKGEEKEEKEKSKEKKDKKNKEEKEKKDKDKNKEKDIEKEKEREEKK